MSTQNKAHPTHLSRGLEPICTDTISCLPCATCRIDVNMQTLFERRWCLTPTKDITTAPSYIQDCVDTIHPALHALLNERDHFVETEVKAILSLPSLSLRNRIILHILAETGLRRRAVAWLTINGTYDIVNGAARSVACATEKGLVTRWFMLSDTTRALLEEYASELHSEVVQTSSPWLFPDSFFFHK